MDSPRSPHCSTSRRRPRALASALVLLGISAWSLSPAMAAGVPVAIGPPRPITFDAPVAELGAPTVARRPDGTFQVVWDAEGADQAGRGVLSLPVSLEGIPLGAPQRLNVFEASDQRDPAIARAGDGLVAVWSSKTQGAAGAGAIVARRLDPWGVPAGGEVMVQEAQCYPDPRFPGTFDCESISRPSIAGAANGFFVAFWEGFFTDGHHTFRIYAEGASFDADDTKLTDVPVGERSLFPPDGATLSTAGETTITYTEEIEDDDPAAFAWRALIERRDASGELVGARRLLESSAGSRALAADPDGNVLAIWQEEGSGLLLGQHFDPAGTPRSGVLELIFDGYGQVVALASDGPGTYLLVWPSPGVAGFHVFGVRIGPDGLASDPFPISSTATPDPRPTLAAGDGEALVVWHEGVGTDQVLMARGFSTSTCHPDEHTLCLGGDRFALSVDWTDHHGQSGLGQADSLTPDSGTFWFFNPNNLELVVKVHDGRVLNDHYWTFYGALSNVGYRLEVADLVAGRRRVYTNPAGVMASVGDTRSLPGTTDSQLPIPSSLFPIPNPRFPSHQPAPTSSTSPGCETGGTTLCLRNGRFRVEVTWHDFSGASGSGHSIPLTSDTGAFWFFNPNNVELMLKVLDGGPINGKFWVFYGALSNVEYEVTVTDTHTGAEQRYHNPSGHFGSRADVEAFPR